MEIQKDGLEEECARESARNSICMCRAWVRETQRDVDMQIDR